MGVRARSGEVWVATPGGVFKIRIVSRIARQDRCGLDSLRWVKNVPWNRYKDRQDADGDIPEEKAVELEADPAAPLPQPGWEVPPAVVKVRQPPPRAF